jgi:two-component system CheB/CheR fusion protein
MGSSAGGLEALKEFFEHMPADSGMAFVLVPHLDPTTRSILHELLQNYTPMPVSQVTDGTKVKPDNIYVIPPDKVMDISHGTLFLMESVEERGRRHPIDYFFRSLAKDQEERAVGIVLSGTGSEGVLGIKAIKGQGGFVIVQEPGSAKFDSMPLNSISTGLADYTLPPREMPTHLLRYARTVPTEKEKFEAEFSSENLQKIFAMLRKEIGHDFSQYKPKTIVRRIARRMAINQIGNIDDYILHIQKNRNEINLLFRELLIRVTNFFRDPEAFTVLKEKVLPNIAQYLTPTQTLRIWVPACSTGEEAYSVAIVAHEYMSSIKQQNKVQIFATDIDNEAIETARGGVYPQSISVDVSAERLQRYFVKEKDCYRVNKEIREMIVFAVQNAINDPPLSRMDLVCCRNLLIYLSSELQKRLLSIFHYALKAGGILFLGSSESIGSRADLFTAFDHKWKFYKPLGRTMDYEDYHISAFHPADAYRRDAESQEEVVRQQFTIGELTAKLLHDLYAPACAIIKEDGTILYFSGRTGKFLEPAPGRANLNIYNMAREGLRNEVVQAVKSVRLGQKEAVYEGLQVKSNGTVTPCNLKVMAIRKPDQMKGLMMVIFEEAQPEEVPPKGKRAASRGPKRDDRIEGLEHELHSVKEHLQSTIEELETSNEELQSANEELQSTNEELETSREELQSVNEELMTVNAEAQERIERLTRSTNDMRNLLNSTKIATVFLDLDLRIKSFTPPAVRIFKLIQSDIGRPISDIVNILCYDDLIKDMRKVLNTLIPLEKQILDNLGAWYLMKMLPYRTHNNMIDGVVVTFVDISRQKHVEAALGEAKEIRDAMLDLTGECLVLIDRQSGSIVDSNSEFQTLIGKHAWELEELKIWDLAPETKREKLQKQFDREGKPLQGALSLSLLGADQIPVEVQSRSKVIVIGGREYLQCLIQKCGK